MYPNPQEALPLPSRPSLEQYRKRAKDLVRACKSGPPDAINVWARAWLDALSKSTEKSGLRLTREEADGHAARVTEFARKKLASDGDRVGTCRLADAQFVIARAHGFLSWPTFAAHLESLARSASPVSAFEAAADAIVRGDASTLQRLLKDHPDLVHARSTREHRATLLHYVSANGVEGYRQESPKNAALIAEILLNAGAEVDPEAEVYGSGCTPLGLVATSTPPLLAGVQREVMDVLLAHGARMDYPGSTGHQSALIRGALMNGCPDAAEYLADRGAPLDFSEAAGVGRLDLVKRYFGDEGRLAADVTRATLEEGFGLACVYGRVDVVNYLLDRGIDVNLQLRVHGEGHTALHVASYHGHVEVVRTLLRRGADVRVRDLTWKTPPLYWVLTGWSRNSSRTDERYYEVVALLVAAGAEVSSDLLEWEPVRSDSRMQTALSSRHERR